MSYQAHNAVLHGSRQTKLLRIMTYLAEHADENLRVDPAPGQDTIAQFFGTSARTVRNWLGKLEQEGELKRLRAGSGPGTASAYLITLPKVENGGKPEPKGGKAEAMVEDFAGILSAIQTQMVEIKAEISTLKAEIFGLKAEVFELKAEKVETKGGKTSRLTRPTIRILIQKKNIRITRAREETACTSKCRRISYPNLSQTS